MVKKILIYLVAIVVGWKLLMWFIHNPSEAANKVDQAGSTANQAGDGFATFIGALSGGALLLLIAVGLAVYLATRKK